jgi:hypothetical protein
LPALRWRQNRAWLCGALPRGPRTQCSTCPQSLLGEEYQAS